MRTRICHEMPKEVFEIEGIKWYGANIYTFPNDKEGLIISLAGYPAYFDTKNDKNLILIDWEDMEPLNWNRNQWLEFLEHVEKMNFKRIYVGCIGGHGRTGTFLAIVSALKKVTTNPINFIRQRLCKNCIETISQEEYIRIICQSQD